MAAGVLKGKQSMRDKGRQLFSCPEKFGLKQRSESMILILLKLFLIENGMIHALPMTNSILVFCTKCSHSFGFRKKMLLLSLCC